LNDLLDFFFFSLFTFTSLSFFIPTMTIPDYYGILEVPVTATQEDIRQGKTPLHVV
jgi:hypothetical protein